jgi:drug/metabolite transporter (DMT)-like permease
VVLAEIPPLTINAMRFSLAAAVLAAVALALGSLAVPTRADLGRLALGGVLGTTIYFSMENIGVDLATASDAALLVASYPAVTMGLEILVFRARASWMRFAGVALAMAGVYLIVGGVGSASSQERLVGDLILLGAGLIWAAYNFSTKGTGERYPSVTLVFYQTAAGAVVCWPLALAESGSWAMPSAGSWAIIVYLGLFCSVVAFLFYAYGLKGLEAGSAVNLLNLVPIFGVATAFLVLGEPVGLTQLSGGTLVVAGVLLGFRSAPREASAQAHLSRKASQQRGRAEQRTQEQSAANHRYAQTETLDAKEES